MKRQVGWLAAAAALGLAIPVVFSGVLGLGRDVYLPVYLPVTGGFCLAYLARGAPAELAEGLRSGLEAAGLLPAR